MTHLKTAQQINAGQFGHFQGGGGMSSAPIPTEPSVCSRAPSGAWEFHIWKSDAKPGDRCLCGKLDYKKAYHMV